MSASDLLDAFFDFVVDGDYDTVIKLLWIGGVPDINCRDHAGRTALMAAAFFGHADLVGLLLEWGAVLDHQNSNQQTALHLAVARANVGVIRLLVRRGASVVVRDVYRNTPLMVALKKNDRKSLTAILETLKLHGKSSEIAAVLKAPTFEGMTPLMVAANDGYYQILHLLLDYGAALEDMEDTGTTALGKAAAMGEVKCAQCLIDAGANVDHADFSGNTPLSVAVYKGHDAIVKLLLQTNASLDVRDQAGFTPLHSAVSGGHFMITKLLVERGAALEARSAKGYTPLLQAAEHGNLLIVQYLALRGASVDVESHHGLTPLSAACGIDGGELTRFLMLTAARRQTVRTLNAQDMLGLTALHKAAGKGDLGTVRMLVGFNGDLLHVTDDHGRTPLHVALFDCQIDVARFLATRGGVLLNEDDAVWPIAAIEQLHGLSVLPSHNVQRRSTGWFIEPASVRFVHGHPTYYRRGFMCSGTWFGSPVTVLRPLVRPDWSPLKAQRFRIRFASEVTKWFPLNHPYLLKLYGACHLPNRILLVTERTTGAKTMRDYLRCHPLKKWSVLHQVALAVQYLHERGIWHMGLRGDNIRVTKDGSVKLAGFGMLSSFVETGTEDFRWLSARLLGTSKMYQSEDDIYSLGMCIVEAVTGKLPYADYDPSFRKQSLKTWIMRGMYPTQSPKFSNREWDLVLRMAAPVDSHRPSITDVVEELEEFARAEVSAPHAIATQGQGDTSALMAEAKGLTNGEIGSHSGAVALACRAFQRLDDVRPSISLSTEDVPVAAEERFRICLQRLVTFLKTYKTSIVDIDTRQFAERQQGDAIFSIHNSIDRLRRELSIPFQAAPIHEWRPIWHKMCAARLDRIEASLSLQASSDRVDELTCLYFELTRHRLSYPSTEPQRFYAACRHLKQISSLRVADWFLPHYEIDFDEKSEFAHGSFGSVHLGQWMHSRVVVKKVFAEDAAAFEREVEIWFQLYHPHVVQLFGACHLANNRFFVCEVAEHGPLDAYLKRSDVYRRRVVWRHLYEAALALQFLHFKQILHRDLKCNNILVGRDGATKLTDFGLSSVASNERTSKTHASGATRWKAPEVLRGEAASEASDVYSLAMCIVEAVTDKAPWCRANGKADDRSFTDSEVKEFVKDSYIMERPLGFSDAQWELVECMAQFDPEERLRLDDAVETMRKFAQEAAVAPDSTPEHGEKEAEETGASSTTASEPTTLSYSDSSFGASNSSGDSIPSV